MRTEPTTQAGPENHNPILIAQMLFAPTGFWPRDLNPRRHPRAPACIHTRRFKKVRNKCIVVWKVLSIWWNQTRTVVSGIRSGFAIFERQIHSNYNMTCITILARSNKFASKWQRFWSKTNCKRFQRSWRWILGEKQPRGYRRKFWSRNSRPLGSSCN